MVTLAGRPAPTPASATSAAGAGWSVPPRRPDRITLLRPWRGPAPDPASHPHEALSLQVATARYVGGLFLVAVLLQRFSTYVLPEVALLLPLVFAWALWGLLRGIITFHRQRLMLWLAAAGSTAFVVPFQDHFTHRPLISPTAWALIVAVWLPGTLVLKDRRRATYVLALRYIAYCAAFLAAGCVIFMVAQVAGLEYQDYLADALPRDLLLQGFVITYPITYGNPLQRANAWFGLEPSIVSILMGVGMLAGLLSAVRLRLLALIAAGMLCATAGSGLAILLVALFVMLGYPVRRNFVRYTPVAVLGVLGLLFTPFGQSILSRATEASTENSSTSLRGIQPYEYMWPRWVDDPMAVLFGRGPGSSQVIVEQSHIVGLLVPTPVKIFFEYGVLAGVFLAACILFCYVAGPSRSLAISLLASLWLLQPGTTTIVVVLPLFLVSTWWAPRFDPVLESDEDTFSLARSYLERAARWRPFAQARTWRIGGRRYRSTRRSGVAVR